jgi:hypothetical protein
MENQTNNAVENTPAIQNITVAIPAEMDFSKMVERSANLSQLKPMITLTAEYVELEKPGESFDGIFIGWQDMEITDKQTGEAKTLKASRFLN